MDTVFYLVVHRRAGCAMQGFRRLHGGWFL